MGRAAAIAFAFAFARERADVAFGYLPQEEFDAQKVVHHIRAAGRKAVPLPGDIRDEAFCQKLVADAAKALGGIDILVNNAARQIATKKFDDITTEHFDGTFKTNVYANFWITKAALAWLPAGGAIINTSSIDAWDPQPTIADYAATKAAIRTFTRSLDKQLAERGIRVNAVAPGPGVDAVATQRWPAAREAARLRRGYAGQASRPARGAGVALCAARFQRGQFHHVAGVRRDGRQGRTVSVPDVCPGMGVAASGYGLGKHRTVFVFSSEAHSIQESIMNQQDSDKSQSIGQGSNPGQGGQGSNQQGQSGAREQQSQSGAQGQQGGAQRTPGGAGQDRDSGQQSQSGGSSQQGGRSTQGLDDGSRGGSSADSSDGDLQQGSSNTNRSSGDQSR